MQECSSEFDTGGDNDYYIHYPNNRFINGIFGGKKDLAGLKGQVIFYGFMLEASNAASLPGLRLKNLHMHQPIKETILLSQAAQTIWKFLKFDFL